MSRPSLHPRRKPIQDRSQQRVDAILDAVLALLPEKGLDALTTHGIAKEAGIPVGSIYQFFPNKFAIYTALVRRFLDQVDAIHVHTLDPDSIERPWEERVDETLDDLLALWKREKACAGLWMDLQTAPELRALVEAQNKKNEENNLRLLAKFHPYIPKARLRIVARVMVHFSNQMVALSVAGTGRANAQVGREYKTIMKAYIRTLIAERDMSEGT